MINKSFRWVGSWMVAQVGGTLGIVANWKNDPAYVFFSVLYLVVVVAGAVLIRWFSRLPSERQVLLRSRLPRWTRVVPGFIVILWAWPLEPVFPIQALLWSLSIILAMVLLDSHFSSGTTRFILLSLGIAAIWFSLSTVMIYPKIYTDEGWLLNKSWSSIHQGPFYSSSINLGVHGDPEVVSSVAWWPVGLWLRITGLGIWQGRLFLWFCGVATVVIIFRAAQLMHNRTTAWIAALFTAWSTLLLYISHFVRPEAMLTMVIALALYFHARVLRYRRGRDALLLGLILALSVEVHPNAVLYCAAFGLLYSGCDVWLSWRQRSLVIERRLLGLAAGGIIGAALYVIVRILPDPQAFSDQMNYYYSSNYGPSHLSLDLLKNRLRAPVNHVRSWFALSLVEGNAVFLSTIEAFVSRRPADVSLAVVLLSCLGGWLVLGSRPAPTYIALLLPPAALLVGSSTAHISRQTNRIFIVTVVLILSVAGLSLNRTITARQAGYNEKFDTCLSAMKDRLPDNGMILGEHLFWLARPKLDSYASRTLVEFPWKGRPAAGWVRWIKPDIVLWPGPVYGPVATYVLKRNFQLIELPDCSDFASIWVRPGVEFSPHD
jgi:4-amino-4-deoxy-L-arabinose transferase-like glycosyltransferase